MFLSEHNHYYNACCFYGGPKEPEELHELVRVFWRDLDTYKSNLEVYRITYRAYIRGWYPLRPEMPVRPRFPTHWDVPVAQATQTLISMRTGPLRKRKSRE